MALIQCTSCQNEYDNCDAVCPYCGMPTPPLANAKSMGLRLLIIALFAVGAWGIFGESSYLKEGIGDIFAVFSSQEKPIEEEYGQNRSQTNANDTIPLTNPSAFTVDSDELFVGVPIVDMYTAGLVQLLAQEGSNLSLKDAPVEYKKNNFMYLITNETTVTLELDQKNEVLRSVTLNHSNERTLVKRLDNVRGAFFVVALAGNVSLEDMNAQLDYLVGLVKASRKNEASYELQNHQFSANYDQRKKTISIKLTM